MGTTNDSTPPNPHQVAESTRRYLRHLSNAHLYRMVTGDRSGYRPDAIESARAELSRRGLSRSAPIPAPEPAAPAQPRAPEPLGAGPLPKGAWQEIIGKRIEHVVTVGMPYPQQPGNRLYLVFDDGTSFEIYGGFQGTNRIYSEDFTSVLAHQEAAWKVAVFGPGTGDQLDRD